MTIIKIRESVDVITITAIGFIFKTTRIYERIGVLWYNKKLHQELTDYEMNNLPDKDILWGKK
jgi:hypothetical protein